MMKQYVFSAEELMALVAGVAKYADSLAEECLRWGTRSEDAKEGVLEANDALWCQINGTEGDMEISTLAVIQGWIKDGSKSLPWNGGEMKGA